MPSNAYQRLLDAETPPEAFVRRALGQLEEDFRDAALVTLAAWDAAEVVSPALFSAVASLQRPSWGSWNGLLVAVRKARREALQRGAAEVRARVEAQAPLAAVMALYDRRLTEAERDALAPLAALTRFKLSARSRFSDALAMPITLRNRVAHDAPSDPRWWLEAADALRPLVALHAAEAPLAKATADAPRPAPWFHEADGDVWTFAGVSRDFAVQYLSPQGASRYEAQASGPVLQAFQRLLGKADVVATDLRKLLSKLAPEDIKGVALGDYLVGRPIGEGGFATVHVGTQLSTGRKVAVKLLRDGLPEEARLRFLQEAAFLSRFHHPHIVGVVGRGEEAWSAPRAFSLDEEPWYQALKKGASVKSYIAMEWVDGQTLDAVFRDPREERPSYKTLLRWFSEAASALSAVHGMGLVHRDVKPANLMVSGDGAIKLMDFGIARSQEEDRTLMTMGGAVGTPAYMSPEQIRAADADSEVGPATDIYSLCATFYELFTGQRLYGHDTTPAETVKTAKLSGALPRPPRALAVGLPWEVEAILLGGLQPELSDRYASVDNVHQDIERVLRDEPIVYQKPSMWRRLQLGYRRNRLVSNLVAGFLLFAALGAWGWIWSLNVANEETETARAAAVRQRDHANKTIRAFILAADEKLEGLRNATSSGRSPEHCQQAEVIRFGLENTRQVLREQLETSVQDKTEQDPAPTIHLSLCLRGLAQVAFFEANCSKTQGDGSNKDAGARKRLELAKVTRRQREALTLLDQLGALSEPLEERERLRALVGILGELMKTPRQDVPPEIRAHWGARAQNEARKLIQSGVVDQVPRDERCEDLLQGARVASDGCDLARGQEDFRQAQTSCEAADRYLTSAEVPCAVTIDFKRKRLDAVESWIDVNGWRLFTLGKKAEGDGLWRAAHERAAAATQLYRRLKRPDANQGDSLAQALLLQVEAGDRLQRRLPNRRALLLEAIKLTEAFLKEGAEEDGQRRLARMRRLLGESAQAP